VRLNLYRFATLARLRFFRNRRSTTYKGLLARQFYTMPLDNHSKKPGGRPRKHSSAAAAIEAKKQSDRRRYLRSLQTQAPADFVAFEPPHPDIPTDTPLSGLRTSSDIRIPSDVDAQIDVPTNLRPISPPPTQPPLSDKDAGMAEQITQIRIDEEQSNFERAEYEAEISQQLNEMDAATVEILMGMRSANTTSVVEEARAGEPSRLSKGWQLTWRQQDCRR
jgi:hypothetical protein